MREVGADARGPEGPGSFGIRPPADARGELDEGGGIHLDDVGWGAARVPRPLDDLCRPERRNADLDRRPRGLLGKQLEQIAHGSRSLGPARCAVRNGSEGARPASVVILGGTVPRYAGR